MEILVYCRPYMQRRQRFSLADTLLVGGFVLSLVALMGAGCFEAWKIVSLLPAAFESAPSYRSLPMGASDDDSRPNQFGSRRMTPRQRAQERQRAEQQER